MTGLFLTEEEISDLTGYRYAVYQMRWLKQRGWKFEVAADGKPRVLRAHLDLKLGGTPKRDRRSDPNWEALRAL